MRRGWGNLTKNPFKPIPNIESGVCTSLQWLPYVVVSIFAERIKVLPAGRSRKSEKWTLRVCFRVPDLS